jgi:hypothetical protein
MKGRINDNTAWSRSSHSITRCWTLRNQSCQRNQFHAIHGIPSQLNLTDSQEFLSVPEFCSIPATSTDSESDQFPEFRSGIASTCCRLTFEHNTMHVGEGGDRFRYGIPGIESKRNWTESDRIPGIGGNWFRGRNQFRNVQHCGIGCIL